MKWIDYREKLGIGFSDIQKPAILANKISNYLLYDSETTGFSRNDYYEFCLMTGLKYSHHSDPRQLVAKIISLNNESIPEILSYYIAFVNSQAICSDTKKAKQLKTLGDFLDETGIPYSVIQDNDGVFVLPKGAAELDDALVSEPLEWLSEYPNARKTFVIALKQYSEGIYIRDVADNLRKALEAFLQEFLGNSKNLEKNKIEICRYLGGEGVDGGISGLFDPLINTYKKINDRFVKHNDAVDAKLLEFLLYQTGLLIRMVLVVKQSNEDAK